jgi:hypothetical protein
MGQTHKCAAKVIINSQFLPCEVKPNGNSRFCDNHSEALQRGDRYDVYGYRFSTTMTIKQRVPAVG